MLNKKLMRGGVCDKFFIWSLELCFSHAWNFPTHFWIFRLISGRSKGAFKRVDNPILRVYTVQEYQEHDAQDRCKFTWLSKFLMEFSYSFLDFPTHFLGKGLDAFQGIHLCIDRYTSIDEYLFCV